MGRTSFQPHSWHSGLAFSVAAAYLAALPQLLSALRPELHARERYVKHELALAHTRFDEEERATDVVAVARPFWRAAPNSWRSKDQDLQKQPGMSAAAEEVPAFVPDAGASPASGNSSAAVGAGAPRTGMPSTFVDLSRQAPRGALGLPWDVSAVVQDFHDRSAALQVCQKDVAGVRSGCKSNCHCLWWQECFAKKSSEAPFEDTGACGLSMSLMAFASLVFSLGLLLTAVACRMNLQEREFRERQKQTLAAMRTTLHG